MLKVKPGARDIMFRRQGQLNNTASASFLDDDEEISTAEGEPGRGGPSTETGGGRENVKPIGGGSGSGQRASLSRASVGREASFPPLQRRWTFSGAQEEAKLILALTDLPPSIPERDGSTTTSRDVSREGSRHGPDFSTSEGSVPRSSIKRELHKASVAQELSDSVLQLLLEAPPGEWGLPLEAREREGRARGLIKEHFSNLPSRYALSVDAHVVVKDMGLMAQVRRRDRVAVDVEQGEWDADETPRSVITLSCRDRPNLLDTITRIISRLSSAIMDADCMTSKDGLTLDRFVVEHRDLAKVGGGHGAHGHVDNGALQSILETTLNGVDEDIARLSPSRLLRTESPPAPPAEANKPTTSHHEPIPFSELEVGEAVGAGQSGSLHRGTWKGQVVAVKMVKRPDLSDEAAERFLGDFERERNIMCGIRHPNLCRFYGVSVSPSHCCLVYSFLDGGSLADLLKDKQKRYDLFGLALDIAQGMDYLHKRGAMHRDLKSDNIMLDGDGRAVIADFGLVCPTITVHDHTGETGTYRWMAPEVIRHEPYSTAADVYSFGIVLWEVLTREKPFKGMTPIQAAFAVARQGYRPALPPQTPKPLADLIRMCWHDDQMRRPTFATICTAIIQIRKQLLGT